MSGLYKVEDDTIWFAVAVGQARIAVDTIVDDDGVVWLRTQQPATVAQSPRSGDVTRTDLEEQSTEKDYVASMKSDLRNLATAEEAFFSDSLRYKGGTASNVGGVATALDTTTGYVPSTGVTVTVTAIANPLGWNAIATHTATTKKCYMFIAGGLAWFNLATMEGEPRCDP